MSYHLLIYRSKITPSHIRIWLVVSSKDAWWEAHITNFENWHTNGRETIHDFVFKSDTFKLFPLTKRQFDCLRRIYGVPECDTT